MKSAAALLLILAGLAGAAAFSGCNRTYAESRSIAQLDRGKYIVEKVGLCIDCHSPRLPDGSFDHTNWLGGAPIAFTPVMPMPWAEFAPPLAGVIAGYSDMEAVRFLQTGITRAGQMPRPPMPHYQMTQSDAEAVVAYLRSLGKESA